MARLLRSRKKKVGLPPGSLVYTGERPQEKIEYYLIDYDIQTVVEIPHATLDECLKSIHEPMITWINVKGLTDPDVIDKIGKQFKLNPLTMEDILSPSQRPKCEDYKDYLYIVLRLFNKKEGNKTDDEQISLILAKDYLITFTEHADTFFEPIRERIRKQGSRLREYGADYLAYAIIDAIVDQAFSVLEKVDDELEDLEEELMANPTPQTLYKLQKTRREIAILRKNIWPMREVISRLERRDMHLISDHTRFFLHDVHDHTIQMVETIEGFRDVLSGMIDIYLSNISLKMNEIMKVLTIVSTLFVPLTFIASIYGMNFEKMPEISSKYGYPAVLILMATVAFSMLYFFRRKKWI